MAAAADASLPPPAPSPPPSQHPGLRRSLLNKLVMKLDAAAEVDGFDDDDDSGDDEEVSGTEKPCTRSAQLQSQRREVHDASIRRGEADVEEDAEKDRLSPLQRPKLCRSLMQSVEGSSSEECDEEEEEDDDDSDDDDDDEDGAYRRCYQSPSHQKVCRTDFKGAVSKNEGGGGRREEVTARVHLQQSPFKRELQESLTGKLVKEVQGEGVCRNSSLPSHQWPLQRKLQQRYKIEDGKEVDDDDDDDDDDDQEAGAQKPISDSRPNQQQRSSAEACSSSGGKYSRPRIHEDLLPHDFLAFHRSSHSSPAITNKTASFLHPLPPSSTDSSTSFNRSAAQQIKHAYSPLNSHAYNLQRALRSPGSAWTTLPPRSSPSDLHFTQVRQNLSDLKFDHHRASSSSASSSSSSSLSSTQRSPYRSLSGGKERNSLFGKEPDAETRRRGLKQQPEINPKECKNEVYENLETSEDGSRGNFQHHAAMAYTRAPSRDELSKKIANWRRDRKNSRRKQCNDEVVPCEAQKSSFIRRMTIEDPSSQRIANDDKRMEIVKLQDQVNELKCRLAAREGMLAICSQQATQANDENTEITRLSSHIEELKQQLAEKDMQWAAARELLQNKEKEIEQMRKLVYDAEETCTSLTRRNMSNEEEIKSLRCEMAALRWQMETHALRHDQALEGGPDASVTQANVVDNKNKKSISVSQMEAVRKMYHAAIIIARIVPSDECLTLIQLLRMQIEYVLQNPTFSCDLEQRYCL